MTPPIAWRNAYGALIVTVTGFACDRGYPASVSARVRDDGRLMTVEVPAGDHGADAWVQLPGIARRRYVSEERLATLVAEAVRAHVVAASSDGRAVLLGTPDEIRWRAGMMAREARDLPVFWGESVEAARAA